jgi:hypothetical protein
MESDIVHFRRWQFEDFQARAAAAIPRLLAQNPQWEAFDLMAEVEARETLRPLRPDQKAFVLDQYIQARWTAPMTAPHRPLVYRR